MARFLLFVLLLALTVPSFAKQKKHPIPCSEMWAAVSQTLANTNNYRIVAMDEERMRASFSVVGALFPQTGVVSLKPGKHGCDLQFKIGFTGADENYAFRTRVSHALKKLDAAKASADTELAKASADTELRSAQ